MKIPARLERRLRQNLQLAGAVALATEGFLKALKNPQQLFFFPEYTDHGADHMESVLASADELISSESYRLLTPEDVAVLILAVLLHDIAMHLHADSFLALVKANEGPLIPEFDARSWKEEFEDYFSRAQRWDERKLFRILGDQLESGLTQETLETIRIHPTKTDPDQWSVKYRKFLGEFIRLKHARLAHEVALAGMGSSVVLQACGLPEHLIDLAGLIARSHNLPVRATFQYLADKYGSRVLCRGTHPVYLMTLLRIADYLQIQSNRVNPGFLSVQRLRSPLSQEEWNTHLVVESIQKDDDDKECLYVDAVPSSSRIFTKLRRLLEGIQTELDTSWAVLGEVYSKEKNLKNFGLTIRRVRSNLSDSADFMRRRNPSFYPMHAALDTTGVSMLRLLVKPLYGDRPEVGVRELLQNSLDAVRELEQVIADNLDYRSVPRLKQSCDVLIRIVKQGGADWLIISDRGIGMTAEVVKEFYLKAGASFRQSDAWWNEFVSNGKSKILRSGRFGIGALAAFLLGDRLQVQTRNVKASPQDGVSFDVSMDVDAVELKRVALREVGTRIKIRLNKEASTSLREHPQSWDWYVLRTPSVERFIDKKKLKTAYAFPNWREVQKRSDWRIWKADGLEAVQWTYMGERRQTFSCNGIKIAEWENPYFSYEEVRGRAHPYYELVSLPSLSIYDPDANLCLNLQRTTVESEVPFINGIMREIYLEFIAFLLVYGPRKFSDLKGFSIISSLPISVRRAWCGWIEDAHCPFFVQGDGFGVLTPRMLRLTGSNIVIKYILEDRRFLTEQSYSPERIQIFASNIDRHHARLSFLIWQAYYGSSLPSFIKNSALLLINPNMHTSLERMVEDHVDGVDGFSRCASIGSSPLYCGTLFDKEKSLLASVSAQIEKRGDDNIVAACELHFDWKTPKFPATTFDNVWQEVCTGSVIPFDLKERRRLFSTTFARLKSYIRDWENARLVGWRKSLRDEVLAS